VDDSTMMSNKSTSVVYVNSMK